MFRVFSLILGEINGCTCVLAAGEKEENVLIIFDCMQIDFKNETIYMKIYQFTVRRPQIGRMDAAMFYICTECRLNCFELSRNCK